MRRVAIVGAGIAGMGAAWSLHRAGMAVSVFECRGVLGGNAKTHRWKGGGETGLSVLAWPRSYFHNYAELLAELGVPTRPTGPLRYFVTDGSEAWAQGMSTAAWQRYAPDLERWERLAGAVRWINRRIDGGDPSLYRVSARNPLAFVPLRWLCARAGISRAFWERVVVPVHSASFLTADLDALPAFILPTIEDVVSLRHGAELDTWAASSNEVFARLAAGFEGRIRRSCTVRRIARARAVTIETDDERLEVDAVILACPAPVALAMLARPSARERFILGGIRYADERDETFRVGRIHRDAGVLPAAHREAIVRGYANHIACLPGRGGPSYANTFVLSSWLQPDAELPMFVSYNHEGPLSGMEGEVRNARAHPELSAANVLRALSLRWLQGRHRTFYCGSWTTPGNGHDLSLSSGLVVAHALGAPYPFAHAARARRDFEALRRFMLGSR